MPAAHAAGLPQVKATWPSEVVTTSANLRAEVNPNGLATAYRFEYLTEAAFEANLNAGKDGFLGALKAPSGPEASVGSGEAPVAVVQHIGGLKASTAYRFHLIATNSEGPVTGPLRYLRTDEPAPVFSLPDGRAWEMVSPVDKGGGEIAAPGALFDGGTLQAAAQGNSVTYGSAAAFAGPLGSPGASQYVSGRNAEGWSTQNITLPAPSGGYGDEPDGVPYRLFSPDLARAIVLDARRCEVGDPCPRSYSLRESATGALLHSAQEPDLRFAGASGDLKAVVFSTCAALTVNATEVPGSEGCDPSAANLYRWNGSSLTLLNLLPGETTGTPGASLAAQGGAISADGSRVYFTQAGNLFVRDGATTVQVDETLGGGGSFETTTPNGAVAFFVKAGHLYRFDVATKVVTDLTPAGEALGALGASEDGSYLYYATSAGLLLRHGASTTTVAAGVDSSNYPPSTGTARISPDGSRLAFLSSAELAPYDNKGQAEAYLYNAASGALTCASCNPSGERPLGPASLSGAVANGKGPGATRSYKSRALSANGARLFFDSFDALVPQDTNGDRDVYQWEAPGSGSCTAPAGCVNLISSGRSEDGASFVDASADGADAFFLTDGSLVIRDPGLVDVYDARVGGGLPEAPLPIPCLGDACQPLPPEPEDPGPGTLFTGTAPNPPLQFLKEKRKAGKHKGKGKRHGKNHKKGHGGKQKQGKRGNKGGRK